ncbi:hypothetical protein [Mesorhizobium sp.]|nr:hypothetical protein [Mesorhizobium sp.]
MNRQIHLGLTAMAYEVLLNGKDILSVGKRGIRRERGDNAVNRPHRLGNQ